MTAIDKAREFVAAKDRIYLEVETVAIVRGLLEHIRQLELAYTFKGEILYSPIVRIDGPTSPPPVP